MIATDFQQDVAEAVVRLLVASRRETPGTLNVSVAGTLDTLHALGPTRVCDLATTENISQRGMGMLVNKLVRMGYAEKLCDPDNAQATLVRLTCAGRQAMFDRHMSRVKALMRHIGNLPAVDQCALIKALPALDKLNAAARQSGPLYS